MKLEVGMYVRGKYYQYRGKIGKIIKNYNNDLEIAYKDGVLKTNVGSFIDDNYDINGRQYTASFDIIDLIEVGDYVNSEKIDYISISKDGKKRPLIRDNIYLFDKYKSINSIVTKEQFEQMAYKVEE